VGAALALDGISVLLVDLDPQANATTGVGLSPGSATTSIYDVLAGSVPAADAIRSTAVKGLACLPASPDLAGAEIELVESSRREHRLADMLTGALDLYDVVLMDCPPSLGLLTVNAMTAARSLLVPVQCEFYALEAVARLVSTTERVQRSLNPGLVLAGFVLTMYDGRTKLAGGVVEEMRNHFNGAVFDAVVPRSVRLSEAPSYGEPVVTFDPSSRGAAAYRSVAAELARRLDIRSGDPGVMRRVTPVPAGRGYGAGAPAPDRTVEWPRPSPWADPRRDLPPPVSDAPHAVADRDRVGGGDQAAGAAGDVPEPVGEGFGHPTGPAVPRRG
jgi:chromosome partitioning protein